MTLQTHATHEKITAWDLIRPYWVSEERWIARGLLVFIVCMNMALVYISVRVNVWTGNFYNALTEKNWHSFKSLLLHFSILAFSFVFISIFCIYYRQMLEIRWRQWLTNHYLDGWLNDNAYYRIERDKLADNPDQRIADDLQALASNTLVLTLDLLSTAVTLFLFAGILWELAGALSFSLAGHSVMLPGYMVWAAVLYALFGSVSMHKVNHPLIKIQYQRQLVEANYRFALVRLRENAEQIAFYNGVTAEGAQLKTLFGHIRSNWHAIMKFTRSLNLVSAVYGQAAIIMPILIAAPRYFAGAFTFGILMRISKAFGSVSDALSWFISNYASLTGWRATVNRLCEFQRVMHLQQGLQPAQGTAELAAAHNSIERQLTDSPFLRVHDLTLALPNGQPLLTLDSLRIDPAARCLIRGPSGAGKSTLMRALAGLWTFGTGKIEVPAAARMMFLPQQSYLPVGTFKAALTYPAPADTITDEACSEVLQAVSLAAYIEQIDNPESEHWARRLSPGEQQRLAFARALLQKPDFLFLDEATSAVDIPTEQGLYKTLISWLPNTAIISIAHRESLNEFHQCTFDVTRISAEVHSQKSL